MKDVLGKVLPVCCVKKGSVIFLLCRSARRISLSLISHIHFLRESYIICIILPITALLPIGDHNTHLRSFLSYLYMLFWVTIHILSHSSLQKSCISLNPSSACSYIRIVSTFPLVLYT